MHRVLAMAGLCLGFALWVAPGADVPAAMPRDPGADADDIILVEQLTKHLANRQRVAVLLGQLASDQFDLREQATAELIALGGLAVPALEVAATSPDPEVAYRANKCLKQIGQKKTDPLPQLLRSVTARKPAGAAAVLLDALPDLDDPALAEQIQTALEAVACRDGKGDPALVAALTDPDPARRLLAAQVLIRAKADDARPSLRRLLSDPDATVRLRVGVELATRGADKEAIPALIDLLTDLPIARCWEIEVLLISLAKQASPRPPLGRDAESRKTYRDAWRTWWEQNRDQTDLAKSSLATFGLGDKTLPGHKKVVWSVAFSPDGRFLASASWDQTVLVWDTVTGKPVWKPQEFARPVYSVAFSPDGKLLAAAGGQLVFVWDFATGEVAFEVKGPAPVYSIAFSPDSKTLAACGAGVVVCWDAGTGKEVRRLTHEGKTSVTTLTFSSDGKSLATGSGNGLYGGKATDSLYRLWDFATGEEIKQYRVGHTNGVNSITFSPDGTRLAAGGYDKSGIRVWDVETGKVVHQFRGQYGYMHAVAFSPDGTMLALGSSKLLRLVDSATGKEIHQWKLGANPFLLRFSPDGSRIALGTDNNDVLIFDVLTTLTKRAAEQPTPGP